MRDDTALVEAMARLAMAATGDFAVDDMLRELSRTAAASLGVDGAGVMGIADAAGQRPRGRFVHADQITFEVEQLQELLQQGPCRDAMDGHEPVAITDVADQHGRWPEFTTRALASQLRAVVAVPLLSRGRVWGSLDLYRRAPGPWADDELAAAKLLADVAVSYLVMAHDRDEARAARQELEHRALHDQLTGLPNRGLLFDRTEHALATATRRGSALALAFLDLDRFKEINDTFGHDAGDNVLVQVARRMSTTLRTNDTLARLAGDEFVLLCEDLPTDAAALDRVVTAVTSRLRAVLARPIRIDGIDVVISASIGISLVTTGTGLDAQDLLRDADTAMYAAKERGRNAVVRRDHTDGAAIGFGRQLDRDLVSAVAQRQLVLHYQPIVTAADGRIGAVEALLRWNHPEHGLLYAQQFIGTAVASSAASGIGAWVVETACAQLTAWRGDLGDRAPELVFCNLSPRELSDPDLQESIATSLAGHGLVPADLGLEILEDAFADPLLVDTLQGLQQHGHPLAVDDFGTGYSSLSRLVGFPVTHAKIDKTFVAGLPDDARSRGLIDAVLTVARNLDVRVIAEGVETAAQQAYLTGAGCHLLQGYHLAHPLPADELTALLQSAKSN